MEKLTKKEIKQDINKIYIEENLNMLKNLILHNQKLENSQIEDSVCMITSKLLTFLQQNNVDYYSNTDLFSILSVVKEKFGKIKITKFKGKKLLNIFCKIFKELTDEDIKIIQQNFKINRNDLLYLNCYFAYFDFCKITGPGRNRIFKKFLETISLKKESFREEEKEIIFCVYKKQIATGVSLRLKRLKCINTENFRFLYENSLIPLNKYLSHDAEKFKYLLYDAEKFNILSRLDKISLIAFHMENPDNKDEFLHCLDLIDKNQLSNERFYTYSIFVKFIEFNMLDVYDFNKIKMFYADFSLIMYNCLLYAKKNFFAEKLVKYILLFIEKIGEAEIDEKVLSVFQDITKSIDYEKINKDLLKVFLTKINDLTFLLTPQNFAQYIHKSLKNKKYLEIMGISESDKITILKAIVENELLDGYTREEIKKSYMTKEDKINEYIKEIESATYGWQIHSILNVVSNEDIKILGDFVVNRIFEIINSDNFSSELYSFDIVHKLFKAKYFTPESLFNFFTKISENYRKPWK